MEILPAIDLLNGKCVRLIQGRYDRVINYERDPVEVAGEFAGAGARWLHVVDLDGARDGEIANLEALREIVGATGLKVQFGGGVRDEAAIDAALEAGATRVIVGTRALEDWDWFRSVVHDASYARKLALGLDARLRRLVVRGWTRDTERSAIEVIKGVTGWPLAAIVYTDVGRDGLLLGPNIDAIRGVVAMSTVPVVASGGVTDLSDVQQLSTIALEGVVIGRAIYEGGLCVKDALRVVGRG